MWLVIIVLNSVGQFIWCYLGRDKCLDVIMRKMDSRGSKGDVRFSVCFKKRVVVAFCVRYIKVKLRVGIE